MATSIPNPNVPVRVGGLDKVAHFCLYAPLAWLVARSLVGRRPVAPAVVGALLVASAFGALDEWHQLYVPGRSADVADWRADSLGALAGVGAFALWSRRRPPSIS